MRMADKTDYWTCFRLHGNMSTLKLQLARTTSSHGCRHSAQQLTRFVRPCQSRLFVTHGCRSCFGSRSERSQWSLDLGVLNRCGPWPIMTDFTYSLVWKNPFLIAWFQIWVGPASKGAAIPGISNMNFIGEFMRPTPLSLDAERWLEAAKRANRQALKISMAGWIDGTVPLLVVMGCEWLRHGFVCAIWELHRKCCSSRGKLQRFHDLWNYMNCTANWHDC